LLQQAPKEGVTRHADGNAWQAGGDDVIHDVLFRQDHRESAGPECLGQHAGGLVGFCE